MGPTWVLSAPDGSLVGPMNLAIRDIYPYDYPEEDWVELMIVIFLKIQKVKTDMESMK